MSRLHFTLAIVAFFGILLPAVALADRVIAVVNDQKIFESELDAFTEKIPAPFKSAFKKKALQKKIDEKVFYSMGLEKGLMDTEEFVQKMENARYAIITDMFIEKVIKPTITVTDEQVKAYYQQNRERFNTAEKLMPGHILFGRKETADAIRKKITTDNFEEVIAGLSDTAPDARFFKLGWVEKGKSRMPEAFDQAVFALKKGEISPVVKTKIGYHIIKIYDVQPGEKRTFDQVKDRIRNLLVQENLARTKKRYIDAAEIEILVDEYKIQE